MKRVILFLFLIFCIPAQASVELYFSPYDNVEDQWIRVINTAEKSIKISCFGLTNERIYNALVEKRKQGIKVLVCEDKMQSGSRHDYRDRMKQKNIEVVVKKVQVLEHNKMLAVDDKSAIIGSWNLSGNAQKQDNSVVVMMYEPELAGKVDDAIDRIWERDK